MLRKAVFLSLLYFLTFTCFSQDRYANEFRFLSDTNTERLSLDCKTKDCNVFLNNAFLFKNLKTLKLSGLPEDANLNAFSFFPALQHLEIRDSYKLKAAELGNALSHCMELNHLNLSGSSVKSVPHSFTKLKGLKYINLSETYGFKQAASYRVLAQLPVLDSLDVSKNYMNRIHKSIRKFVELDYLNIEHNDIEYDPFFSVNRYGINSPADYLQLKVNSLQVNSDEYNSMLYYSFYAGLAPEKRLITDYDDLGQADYDIIFGYGNRWMMRSELDSVRWRISDRENEEETEAGRFYGEFNTGSAPVVVKSLAYLHYPSILKESSWPDHYDSTLFEDRFKDLRYAGVGTCGFQAKASHEIPAKLMSNSKREKLVKEYQCFINPVGERSGNVEIIRSFSGFRKSWFLGKKEYSPGSYIASNYPELTAFAGCEIQLLETNPSSPLDRCFTDIRIGYDEAGGVFSMTLKSTEGFETFAFRLERPDTIRVKQHNQKTMEKYRNSLDAKEDKFNRSLEVSRKRYEQKKTNSQKRAWKSFRKNRMVRTETVMPRSEWEEYYRQVTANEKEAVYNSEVSTPVFGRALEIKGLKQLDPYQWHIYYDETKRIIPYFEDRDAHPLIPEKIVLIDKKKGVFTTFNAAGREYESRIFFPVDTCKDCEPGKFDLFVQFKNDKYALVRNVQLTGAPDDYTDKILFNVELLPAELSDIRLVMRKLNY